MAGNEMSGIFISYRRDDSAGWTGRLATDLQERFSPDVVFQDIDAIEAGENFIVAIDRSLTSCSVVLVVIGPEWTFVKDKTGNRRLDNPNDTVRLEVAKALGRKDRLVIPVLVGGAQMPSEDELPSELRELAQRNAFELSDTRWTYDFDRLVEVLVKHAGLAEKSYPSIRERSRAARWLGIISIVFVAAVGSIASYWYFVSKNPFLNFSIDQPRNGDELPLGENQQWLLEGTLHLAEAAKWLEWLASKPTIDVEVRKLPERQAIPQEGNATLNNVQGLWRFDSAKFRGEGDYEILTKITFAGKTDWRPLRVRCLPKANAYRQAIAEERSNRGTAPVIPLNLNPEELSDLKQRVIIMQDKFFDLYDHKDLDAAESNAIQTLDMLDPVLLSNPNDWLLQNLRAYALKNYAMTMKFRGNTKEFERALDGAEKMFKAIRQQNPNDPGAWNGLGSVASLRNDYSTALQYINRALEILPTYPAAKEDRVKVINRLKMLEEQKQRIR